jgi:CheY-like chemotaxis protein
MNKPANDSFLVLVADDSADDRFLLRTAMRRTTRLQIVGETADGEETIAFLRRQLPARDRTESLLPDLLLLDLRMPVKDGFDVLKWLRAQHVNRMTVVVLTDTMQPDHIRRALELGADLFQVKPKLHHEQVAMVLALEQYLLTASLAGSPRRFNETTSLLPPLRPARAMTRSA